MGHVGCKRVNQRMLYFKKCVTFFAFSSKANSIFRRHFGTILHAKANWVFHEFFKIFAKKRLRFPQILAVDWIL